MSKTLNTILEIAAIAVLAVVTYGVGAGIAGGATLGASIGNLAAFFGVSSGLLVGGALAGVAAIGQLLQKTPKPPRAGAAALKSPTPSRIAAYGEVRLAGAYILYVTDANGNAVDVWAFHDGRIDQVIQYFIGDRRVQVVGGVVQALPDKTFENGHVLAGSNLGLPTETAFAAVISHVPDQWTADHRGDGVVTGYMISDPVKSKNFGTVYSTGGPNATPMSLAMHAQPVFDWRDMTQSVTDPTTWKWSANAVLHLAHYLLVRMNRTWSLHFAPTLSYWTAAADDADIGMELTQVQTILAFAVAGGDTNVTVYDVNGLAVGMTISIYVSGNSANTETRVVTSIVGFVIHFASGLSHKHPQGSQVIWQSDPSAPAYEQRYRSCVSHEFTDAHKDVIAHLIACFDGYLTSRSDGALVVYSGRYTAPTVTIGPDEIISYSIQDYVDEESAINTIKITYISANHDYSSPDTDDWTDEDDIASRGKVLSDALENQVPSYSQGRRLAKRAMVKLNAPYRGSCTCNAAGRIVIGQRYIHLTVIEAGSTFFDGPVEISKTTRLLKTGGVSFDWLAADPNIDAWNPATEEGNPAPVGNNVASNPLPDPSISDYAVQFGYNSATEVAGARILLTVVGAPDRDDITWFARWRANADVSWNEDTYSDVDPGSAVQLLTGFLPTNADVHIEVAYQTGDGRLSEYSAEEVISTRVRADSTQITVDSTAIRASTR